MLRKRWEELSVLAVSDPPAGLPTGEKEPPVRSLIATGRGRQVHSLIGPRSGHTPGCPWRAGFRLATTLLYVALNLGLVGLHANEEFYPHSTEGWSDPAAESHHGHNHAACVIFWSSVPSPAPPPEPPRLLQGDPAPPEPAPGVCPPPSPWRKGPFPRGPPPTA